MTSPKNVINYFTIIVVQEVVHVYIFAHTFIVNIVFVQKDTSDTKAQFTRSQTLNIQLFVYTTVLILTGTIYKVFNLLNPLLKMESITNIAPLLINNAKQYQTNRKHTQILVHAHTQNNKKENK